MITQMSPSHALNVGQVLARGIKQFTNAQDWLSVLGAPVLCKSGVSVGPRWIPIGKLLAVDSDRLLVAVSENESKWCRFSDVKVWLKRVAEIAERNSSTQRLTPVKVAPKAKPKRSYVATTDPKEAELLHRITQARANEKTAEDLLADAKCERMEAEAVYLLHIGKAIR